MSWKRWALICGVVCASLFLMREDRPERALGLAGRPAWMQEQIREDLAGIGGGEFEMPQGLLRVKIVGGQLVFSPENFEDEITELRARVVKNFLVGLMQQYRLPDVEFAVCLEDSYQGRVGKEPVFVFSKKKGSAFDILMPDFGVLNSRMLLKICKHEVKKHPWQEKSPGIFLSEGYVPPKEPFEHKYVVDRSVFVQDLSRWVLLSNSALIKPMTGYDQWYSKALKPYVHYVPVKGDLSDVKEVEGWLRAHDEQGREIAERGRELALRLFSQEAIEEYVATLINEYAQTVQQ